MHGLERLIARVADGRQDVRPVTPTLFETDDPPEEWEGEQISELVVQGAESGQPAMAAPAPEATRAPVASLATKIVPSTTIDEGPRIVPPRPSQAESVELERPSKRSTAQFDAAPRMSTPSPLSVETLSRWQSADPEPRRQVEAALPVDRRTDRPSTSPKHEGFVENVENNSIVIEIGRIEVKAPPVAAPAMPASPGPRRGARLSLDAYLSERRAAKR